MSNAALRQPAPPSSAEASPISERRLTTRSGASVTIAERDGVEHIEVRDTRARLVFELDPATGRSVVTVPEGDLGIAVAGDIEIAAGKSIRWRAADEVRVEAGPAGARSTLRLGAALAELVATRVETVADRVFERARSVFRQVDDLYQVRTGRSRTVVKGGFTVESGHASIEAEQEMKIDGKTIHLG
jgi:hypothetical protein